MPPLPASFASLIATAALPLDDLAAQPLQQLARPALRVLARQAVDLLGDGVGTLLIELGVAAADIPAPLTAAELESTEGWRQLVAGKLRLVRAAPQRLLARAVQRAFQALAARCADAPRALSLPRWGSDGGFGEESVVAVRAFQEWRQLPVTGVLAAADARALAMVLGATKPPALFDAAHPVAVLGAGARELVTIARGICEATEAAPLVRRLDGVRYALFSTQFGISPTGGLQRLPGGVAYDFGRAPYWKCNVFCGAVISLAGLSVPTFQAGAYRHFPRAERFAEALVRRPGWQLVTHLDHRDPDDPERARSGRSQDAQIRELLTSARAGDLLFVDHPGPPGDDGGHARICVQPAKRGDRDSAPAFAQALSEAARIRNDGMSLLAGGRESQLWLVRCTVR